MTVTTTLAGALSAACITFAGIVLVRRWANSLATYLALFMASVGVWAGANAAAAHFQATPQEGFWHGLAFMGLAAFCGFFLCFTYVFTRRSNLSLPRLAGYLTPAIIISAVAFFGQFLLPALLVFLLGSLMFGSVRLGRYYRHGATHEEQTQILYMEIGFVSVFSAAAIFSLIMPMFGDRRLTSVGPLFTAVTLATAIYATRRHRLLDVKTVIKRGIVYTLIVGLITVLYLAFVTLILSFISGLTSQAYLIAAIATTCVGVLSYGPLRDIFNRLTDEAFSRNRLSREQAVDAFSRALNESHGPGQMLYGVTTTLRDVFLAEAVTFTVLNSSVSSTDSAKPMTPEECQQMTSECDIKTVPPVVLFVPLILEGRATALIGMGEKKTGEPYYADDLSLLTSFAYQTALALDKSQRYQQAKDQITHLQDQHRRDEEALAAARSQAAHGMENVRRAMETIMSLKNRAAAAQSRGETIDVVAGLASLEQSAGLGAQLTGDIKRIVSVPVFNVSSVVKRVTDHYAVLAERQGAMLVRDIDDDIMIKGISQLIEDSLVATMGTALQHSFDRHEIRVTLHNEHGQAVLCVKAQGRGMTPADLPPYFDQLRRTTGFGGTLGTGLQMSLSPQIISLHDEVLEVKSTDDQTTEVCFRFEIVKENDGAPSQAPR